LGRCANLRTSRGPSEQFTADRLLVPPRRDHGRMCGRWRHAAHTPVYAHRRRRAPAAHAARRRAGKNERRTLRRPVRLGARRAQQVEVRVLPLVSATNESAEWRLQHVALPECARQAIQEMTTRLSASPTPCAPAGSAPSATCRAAAGRTRLATGTPRFACRGHRRAR
jgi:hypothetical protein